MPGCARRSQPDGRRHGLPAVWAAGRGRLPAAGALPLGRPAAGRRRSRGIASQRATVRTPARGTPAAPARARTRAALRCRGRADARPRAGRTRRPAVGPRRADRAVFEPARSVGPMACRRPGSPRRRRQPVAPGCSCHDPRPPHRSPSSDTQRQSVSAENAWLSASAACTAFAVSRRGTRRRREAERRRKRSPVPVTPLIRRPVSSVAADP